jgi:lysophosphatidylcholine acyltransferase / lyso-PAF acetyltransferase
MMKGLESELKDLNSKPPKPNGTTTTNDVYGTMGRGELGAKEKLFLGFALVTLLPIRVILAVTVLVVYYVVCRVCTLFKIPNREDEQEDYAHLGGWRRSVIVKCGKALSRAMLFIFGFYWIHVSSNSFNQVSILLSLFC